MGTDQMMWFIRHTRTKLLLKDAPYKLRDAVRFKTKKEAVALIRSLSLSDRYEAVKLKYPKEPIHVSAK